MNCKILLGLAVGLAGPLCVGCTSAPGVIRGQTPAGPAGGVEHAQYFGDRAGPVTPAAHSDGEACDPDGRGRGNGSDGYGEGWYPTHYHWYSYEAPRNLVYPPQNVPASVVFYPYYTCKGPDDFFKAH